MYHLMKARNGNLLFRLYRAIAVVPSGARCALVQAIRLLGFFFLMSQSGLSREELKLDANWSFHPGDTPDAQQVDYDANSWRKVELPHDWSIEGKTDPAASSSSGGGFFPTGIGWYRRVFTAPESWRGQRVSVEVEG